MKKIIIFGAGYYGDAAFYKLRKHTEIVYYVDNNLHMQGTRLHDIPIISVRQLESIYDPAQHDIIICVKKYQQIIGQLLDMELKEYFVLQRGLLYYNSAEATMLPLEICEYTCYKKEHVEKNILFVQDTVCVRTHKIATLMKKNGYKIFLLYTMAPPEINNVEFAEVYDGIYTFYTWKALIDFVENSDFDIVHSSNEPDILTNILLLTKKHIVFDTHDMMSLRKPEKLENLVLEFIANTASDGNIYTSDLVAEIARKKFDLTHKEIIAWENTVLEQEKISEKFEKLSSADGEIHCVYEGGINGNDILSHRFFEKIWKKIADCGIHIHFYSQSNYQYCKELEAKSRYFHYEGNLGTKVLIQEMTKYDCGLLLLNVNEQNKAFLATASPNKLYEYLNAALPVVVSNIKSLVDFVEKYGVGKKLNMEGDIKEQIAAISRITIEEDFLTKNKLTMMSKSQELIEFYERVMKRDVIR